MMRAETFTRPRSVADAVVTTTTASALATRSAWLLVNVTLPLAVVEQCGQSMTATGAALFVARSRSEADIDPWSAGRRSFHVSTARLTGGIGSDGSTGFVPPTLMRSVPVNFPEADVPATGTRRA